MDMLFSMFKSCNTRVIDGRHKGAELSGAEKQQLQNCYVKYLKAPESVMGGLDGAASHGF